MKRDRGAWIQTYTGRKFHYNDPQPDDIHVADIARALSNLCRYAGHTTMFYSVAEHSVLMSRLFADPLTRFVALMHDATEAYCVDIPRPLKRMLPDYTQYEEGLWKVIARKFGLPEDIPAEVHEMDTRVLISERPFLFRKVLPWPKYAHVTPLEDFACFGWQPRAAEEEFLAAFTELKGLQ